jgi:hypothetical protein
MKRISFLFLIYGALALSDTVDLNQVYDYPEQEFTDKLAVCIEPLGRSVFEQIQYFLYEKKEVPKFSYGSRFLNHNELSFRTSFRFDNSASFGGIDFDVGEENPFVLFSLSYNTSKKNKFPVLSIKEDFPHIRFSTKRTSDIDDLGAETNIHYFVYKLSLLIKKPELKQITLVNEETGLATLVVIDQQPYIDCLKTQFK